MGRNLITVVAFDTKAMTYARTIGLDEALSNRHPPRLATKGKTYSALARLDVHEQVEAASEVINDFVYEQLEAHPTLARHVGRVVGELHDNVASHSRGVGFSAAQNYGTTLELAIADNGQGMLRNVQRQVPAITTDEEAIAWCLVKGNTTGAIDDDMAQWLPPDATSNPYPRSVTTRSSANHHLGEGLWQLSELVKTTGGELFIWSGTAQAAITATKQTFKTAPRWQGVVIEVTLPIAGNAPGNTDMTRSAELDALAKRLGL